jgi:hypothetical protein
MDTRQRTAPRLLCLIFGVALVLTCLLAIFGQEVPASDPGGPAAGPFDYFRNNWTVVGLPDYSRGTRITPDGQLLLDGLGRVTIQFGDPPAALSRRQSKTLLDGWLPIVRIEAAAGDIRYEFLIWASPLPDSPDIEAAFASPSQGENYANWILVRTLNAGKSPAKASVRIRNWVAEKEYAVVAEAPAGKTSSSTAK